MNQNPFEFGIFQRVRRWFAGDQNGAALDAEIERRIFTKIKTDSPPMPECKPPRSQFESTDRIASLFFENYRKIVDEACAEVATNSSAALIAVIQQWGPITFADETIEANKKKKIQIKRENGFVKFSVEKSDNAATEWPDETRIDIIGANGNDGDHYAQG